MFISGLSLRRFGGAHVVPAKLLLTERPQIPLLGLAEVRIADLVPNFVLFCKQVIKEGGSRVPSIIPAKGRK